jgi:hypothetical protein
MPPGYTTPQGGAEGPWHERLPHFLAGFTPSAGDELQTEYLVPRDQAVAALAALDGLAPRIAELLLVCELRTVAADDCWLSPCYGRDTAAVHFTWRKDPAAVTALLPAIEDRLAPFDPRPHWGKLFTLPPERIAASYPRMAAFRRLMAAHDPDGKFRNSFIDRVISLPRSPVAEGRRLSLLIEVAQRTLDLHETSGVRERREAAVRVHLVRVRGGQHEPAHARHVLVLEQRLDHPVREPAAPVPGQHEHVSDPGERGAVGDDAGETDLALCVIQAQVQRVRYGARDDVARHPFGPVGPGEEAVHHVQVDPPRIVVDLIFILGHQHDQSLRVG